MLQRRPWAGHAIVLIVGLAVALLTSATAPDHGYSEVIGLRATGYAALTLLCAALLLGPLARLGPRLWGSLLPARRAFGIWSAGAGLLHLWYALAYLERYGRTTVKQVFFHRPDHYEAGGLFTFPRLREWQPDLSPTDLAQPRPAQVESAAVDGFLVPGRGCGGDWARCLRQNGARPAACRIRPGFAPHHQGGRVTPPARFRLRREGNHAILQNTPRERERPDMPRRWPVDGVAGAQQDLD